MRDVVSSTRCQRNMSACAWTDIREQSVKRTSTIARRRRAPTAARALTSSTAICAFVRSIRPAFNARQTLPAMQNLALTDYARVSLGEDSNANASWTITAIVANSKRTTANLHRVSTAARVRTELTRFLARVRRRLLAPRAKRL